MSIVNAKIPSNAIADGRWDRHPDSVVVGDWLLFAVRGQDDTTPAFGVACLRRATTASQTWERVLKSSPLCSDAQFLGWWRGVVAKNGPYPMRK